MFTPAVEKQELVCQIDRTRLDRIKTFTPPADEPTRPPILFTFTANEVTIEPLQGGDFVEITRLGRDYLRWDAVRIQKIASMMHMALPHPN